MKNKINRILIIFNIDQISSISAHSPRGNIILKICIQLLIVISKSIIDN